MRNEPDKTLVLLIISVLFSSPFLSIQGLHAKDFNAELESSTQLIVMIEGLELGAGVIFGWDTAHLYIATANHVVRAGSKEAQNPQIRLKTLPDKLFKATLLANVDRELDLAVIRLEMLNNPEVNPCALRIDRLYKSAIRRGDAVYAVGNPNGVPWGMPVVPDRAAQIVGAQVMFQSAFISKGHSGGGLLNGEGEVIGMIRADQPPFGIATSIWKVLPVLKAWGYPAKLRMANSPSPLYSASEKGSVDEVARVLHEKCPEVDEPYDGMTPLLVAADKGFGQIVDLLLKAGAQTDVTIADPKLRPDTPIQLAAGGGYLDIVQLLLNAGANVEGKRHDNWNLPWTSLVNAVWHGHRQVARLLIKAGAKTDFVNSMLFYAAEKGNVEAVKILIELGADIEQVDEHINTPLEKAVYQGKIEVVKVLLAAATVNHRKMKTTNPLFWAIARCGHDHHGENDMEILNLLVKAIANLDQTFMLDHDGGRSSGTGYTPLTLAAEKGCVEAANVLLEAGANVNKGDDVHGRSRTPLHYAAECRCIWWNEDERKSLPRQSLLLQLLLQAGANINVRDKYGDPPLCRALLGDGVKRKEIVEIFLKAGSVPILPDGCIGKDGIGRSEDESLDVLIESIKSHGAKQ